ncbi:hypothetical protein KCP71_12805 [Salmonella enterica subsp. enterica]|nr:hypothetical protein KCP71_12805 [Salmonella enterica subsp. enterica]
MRGGCNLFDLDQLRVGRTNTAEPADVRFVDDLASRVSAQRAAGVHGGRLKSGPTFMLWPAPGLAGAKCGSVI